MNNIKNLTYLLLLIVGASMSIVACRKKGPEPTPQPAAPSISSIDPATAPVGSTIAINGSNFTTSATGTTVTIGGVTATVVLVTPTRIVVTVPVGAVAGPVAVTVGGQTAQSPVTFTPGSTTTTPAGSKPIAEKSGTSFSNQNWTSDSIYLLRGMVYIPANYTLTIAPGTIIRGAGPERDPAGTNFPGGLVVERLGAIVARGTAARPIVFTSAKAAGQRNYGDWGGVVLEGKSPINRVGTTAYPNGIRGTIGAYGEPNDNSGVLQYVRIEYAGAVQPTTPASRLSGLTLAGVGANTVIDHVQVSYSGSDAFSWFGGSANAKNLFAYRTYDDDWTIDWGYAGNAQFGVSLRDPDVADASGSNGFDVENYEPTVTTDAPAITRVRENGLLQDFPVFTNFSNFAFGTTPLTTISKGTGVYRSAMYLRRYSPVGLYNSVFYGYPEGLRVESNSSVPITTSGTLDLKGIVLANTLTPVAGTGTITTDQATTYFNAADRTNRIIASTDLASLLLNTSNFSLAMPNFLPQTGSPLLSGAVTGSALTGRSFLTSVPYRGAFGTDNWLAGWTNLDPQNTNYDR